MDTPLPMIKRTRAHLDNETISWTILQKVSFRILFVFFSLNTWFGYSITRWMFYPRLQRWAKWDSFLARPLYWLDLHFYHIGYDPGKNNLIILDDKPLGWVLLITITWVSLAIGILWSIADKKRKNYNRLNYWFKTYLAYYLFLSLAFYAIYKIADVQMPFPNAGHLLEPFGNKTKVELFFDFIGTSPGYGIFTGICEFVAGLLVIYRRTRVLGCLVMFTILINVVCLNIFYNIPVKLQSTQLLLITIYLLAPYLSKLIRFFYYADTVSLAEREYRFSTPWKNYAIILLSLLLPVWASVSYVIRGFQLKQTDKNRQHQQIYDVLSFVKDTTTLAPLSTDKFRIKKIIFTAFRDHKYAIIYSMNDSASYYDYNWNNITKKITLTYIKQSDLKFQFEYQLLQKEELQIKGVWWGQAVNIQLKKISADSIPIVKEKINLVQKN